MITVGVDLAAEPLGTGMATISWTATEAIVTALQVGADDDDLLAAIAPADKVGLDCPVGWPDAFVSFVSAHHRGHVPVPDATPGKVWRHALANRHTDDVVRETFGLVPLSVSADRIARPAMRAAGLLAHLAAAGRPVDRDGSGLVVEAYPAASLKQWGLRYRRYKGKAQLAELGELADSLLAAAPWLSVPAGSRQLMASADHALDAVVAGLTARAAALGLTVAPTADEAALARREGWIGVPTAPLSALRPSNVPLHGDFPG